MIHDFGKEHGISYQIRQRNERRIRNIFHDNHFKLFVARIGYLTDSFTNFMFIYQSIRKFRVRKKKSEINFDLFFFVAEAAIFYLNEM